MDIEIAIWTPRKLLWSKYTQLVSELFELKSMSLQSVLDPEFRGECPYLFDEGYESSPFKYVNTIHLCDIYPMDKCIATAIRLSLLNNVYFRISNTEDEDLPLTDIYKGKIANLSDTDLALILLDKIDPLAQ